MTYLEALKKVYLYTRPSEQTSNEWGDPRPHTLGNINNLH